MINYWSFSSSVHFSCSAAFHCVILGEFASELRWSTHPNLDTSSTFLFVGLLSDKSSHPDYQTHCRAAGLATPGFCRNNGCERSENRWIVWKDKIKWFALHLYPCINVIAGFIFSFYQYRNHMLRQILHSGRLKLVFAVSASPLSLALLARSPAASTLFLFTCSVWCACCRSLASLQQALWVSACVLLMQVCVSVYAAAWLTAVAATPVWSERCLLMSLWAIQVEKSAQSALWRRN